MVTGPGNPHWSQSAACAGAAGLIKPATAATTAAANNGDVLKNVPFDMRYSISRDLQVSDPRQQTLAPATLRRNRVFPYICRSRPVFERRVCGAPRHLLQEVASRSPVRCDVAAENERGIVGERVTFVAEKEKAIGFDAAVDLALVLSGVGGKVTVYGGRL